MNSKNHRVLRVYRTKVQAKESYDKISRFYDYFAGVFEKKYRNMTLERLDIKRGETVLEIGFGTGHCLKQMAESVGEEGRVYGIDISSGMLEVSKQRLEEAGLLDRVKLYCGDALKMPYEDNKFDAVFMSFTLELFDTPEIPKVLDKIERVLKANGRLGVVSMSKEDEDSILLRMYEWTHKKFPKYADCRPIYIEQSIKDAGFEIEYKEKVKLFGLPGEIVIGVIPF
ncbi:methyltransferase domain-containing protein [Candidatus Atribacteria bacterium MT.SAG.1]|nr:methyltransferase domain-containing protein [Candidatus Atribacteria bacterium MT.SAG.1]